MDCSLQRSSIHGILQARILDQVAISYSRGILLTQGSTLCLLHWQADYLPLHHLRSPYYTQKVLTTVIHSTVPGSLSSYFWLYAHHQGRSPQEHPSPRHHETLCSLCMAWCHTLDLCLCSCLPWDWPFLSSLPTCPHSSPLQKLTSDYKAFQDSHLYSNTPKAFALPSCFITPFLFSLIIFCLVLQSRMPLTFSHLEGKFLGNVAETLPFPSLSATVTDNTVMLNTDWPSECCHLRNPWQWQCLCPSLNSIPLLHKNWGFLSMGR